MVTIYVSSREVPIITKDQYRMSVKLVMVETADGLVILQDWKPPSELNNVEIILRGRFQSKRLQLPYNVKQAILHFLQYYHVKQDMMFDCYAFANLVKGIEAHKVPQLPKHWDRRPLPWFVPIGGVVFLESGENQFRHAAIHLGHGLYISVWGAGGDLEIATLRSMKRDYQADRIVLATPIKI